MNEEIRERYEKRVESRLADEYEWFVKNCERKSIVILSLTVDSFKRRAMNCSYVLGMKPEIDDDCDAVYDDKIRFVVPNEISIPYAKYGNSRAGGKNPIKKIVNIPNISGFGMSLSLKGWHDFFDGKLSYDKLVEKLKSGLSIEEIFKDTTTCKSVTSGRTVKVGNDILSLKDACSKCGIPYWTMQKKAKGITCDDLQRLFDNLKGTDHACVRQFSENDIWCKVTKSDYEALKEHSESLGISIFDALHRLIETITY